MGIMLKNRLTCRYNLSTALIQQIILFKPGGQRSELNLDNRRSFNRNTFEGLTYT